MYICVESYRNEKEKTNLLYWQLTCESFCTLKNGSGGFSKLHIQEIIHLYFSNERKSICKVYNSKKFSNDAVTVYKIRFISISNTYSMTYIIGINGNLHDSSLVAFNRENETLEYYYSEDRHSGVPHHYGFPHASIEKLRTKINFSAIEAIALSRDVEKYIFPPQNYYSELEEKLREPMRLILSDLYYKNHDKSIDSRLNKATCSVRKLLDSIRFDYKTTGKSTFYYQKKICYLIHNILLEVALLKDIRIHFGDIKVMSIEHHLCHASLSMTSKFDSCTIISWDGRGEFDSTNLWTMDRKVKQPIELIRSIKHPFSLGYFTIYLLNIVALIKKVGRAN